MCNWQQGRRVLIVWGMETLEVFFLICHIRVWSDSDCRGKLGFTADSPAVSWHLFIYLTSFYRRKSNNKTQYNLNQFPSGESDTSAFILKFTNTKWQRVTAAGRTNVRRGSADLKTRLHFVKHYQKCPVELEHLFTTTSIQKWTKTGQVVSTPRAVS